MTAALLHQGYYLRGLFPARSAVGLQQRREIFRPRTEEFFLGACAHKLDRRRVAIHEHTRLRIEQPDRIDAAFKQ